MKPRKPLKRTPLRKVSLKRMVANRAYSKLAKAFKELHPVCQCCHGEPTRDVHHKAGRLNGNLMKVSTWAAVCRSCHDYIHNHPSKARATGWLT
jgi:hypothetical protein